MAEWIWITIGSLILLALAYAIGKASERADHYRDPDDWEGGP